MNKTFLYSLIASGILHIILFAVLSAPRRKISVTQLTVDLIYVKTQQVEHAKTPSKQKIVQKPAKQITKEKPKPDEDTIRKKPVKTEPALPPEPVLSSKVQIEAKDFPYTYYLRVIQNRIASQWQWPSRAGTRKTVAYFRIQRDGTVTSIRIDDSSADYLYDQAALRAIHRALPMPPLPDGFDEEYLGVYFEFSYRE